MSAPEMVEPGEDRGHGRQRTIMDMPIEMLSKIFVLCLGVEHQISEGPYWYTLVDTNPKKFDSHKAPLLLTKVCRLWRTVALSTPYLWTVLPRLGVDDILPESGTDRLFHMYLTHSGNAPLSIGFLVDKSQRNDYTTALLSPHLHRAGQLRIGYGYSGDASASSSLDRLLVKHWGMFKLLTHLRISSYELTHTPQWSTWKNTFEGAPLLKNISLIFLAQKVNLPWSQIEYYHDHVRDLGNVSDILLPCTQLETLDLSSKQIYEVGDDNEVEHSRTQAPIFLPRVRKLCLTDERKAIGQFLDALRAPLLEVVQINDTHHTLRVSTALVACITRSHCTGLASLRLLCSHINVNELRQLSTLAPGLRELDMFLTPGALRELIFVPTKNSIFPHLARLTVRDVNMPDQKLINICRSRLAPDPNGVEGGFQVEPLQYCRIYPRGTKSGSWEAAQRLQDTAESFQDNAGFRRTLDKLRRLNRSIIDMVPDDTPEISSEDLRGLEDCFGFLETFEINHPLLLERHDAVDILGYFSRNNTRAPPHIQARASILLAKWKLLAKEYDTRDTRWFLETGEGSWRTLVYWPDIDIEGCFLSKFTQTD